MNYERIYNACLSILDNPGFAQLYLSNPLQLFAQLKVDDLEEQQAVNRLLIPTSDLRTMETAAFKSKIDYNGKLNLIAQIVQSPSQAEQFYASPYDYLSRFNIFSPEEQQQIISILLPLDKFREEAAKHNAETYNYQRKLNCLIKLVQNKTERDLFKANTESYLAAKGLNSPEDTEFINQLLSPTENMVKEFFEFDQNNQKKIFKVNDSYMKSLRCANSQAVRGFKYTMIMYAVSFYLGVALIITAVVFAFVSNSALFPIVFGTIGTLDLLTFFIAKPPLELQKSRVEHAKLNAAFYSWFLDVYNWNSYFKQFSSQKMMVDFKTMKEVSTAQINNTKKLMEIISSHISKSSKNSKESTADVE